MIILGIDPGFAITGYSILEYEKNNFTLKKAGAILTDKDEVFEDRLKKIFDELNNIINVYKPDEMSIEELFFNTNSTTAIKVAEARGIVLLCAKLHDLNIGEYTPLQVKQGVCGYGRADKKQVQMMVKSILKLPGIPKLDDITDSMAIAICHGHSRYINNLKSQNINKFNIGKEKTKLQKLEELINKKGKNKLK